MYINVCIYINILLLFIRINLEIKNNNNGTGSSSSNNNSSDNCCDGISKQNEVKRKREIERYKEGVFYWFIFYCCLSNFNYLTHSNDVSKYLWENENENENERGCMHACMLSYL